MKALEVISKAKFELLLLLAALVLFAFGYFTPADLKGLKFTEATSPRLLPIFAAVGCLVASVGIGAAGLFSIGQFGQTRPKYTNDGITTRLAETTITLSLGTIEAKEHQVEDRLVVLPANEFFDDECIRDPRSALGAYVAARFPNRAKELEDIIAAQLKDREFSQVEKAPGVYGKSYGVGTSVFLRSPLNSSQPILLLAVTTKRANEGLRSEVAYLFSAVKEMHRTMADNRLLSVILPVLGSGHGNLKPVVALFGLLLALCDAVASDSHCKLRDITIVVFQAPGKASSVSKAVCKRLLQFATSIYSMK